MDSPAALRNLLRARRLALPASERIAAAEALAQRLRELPALQAARRVGGYWAVRGELSLHALLSPAPAFTYLLPCLQPGHRLCFAPWHFGQALVQNRYGIPEPDVPEADRLAPGQLDVVLVPLLAFDRAGNRLGAGGGYYDRSFAFLLGAERPARPLLVGIGYDFQAQEALPAARWDVALDLAVTPTQTLRFA